MLYWVYSIFPHNTVWQDLSEVPGSTLLEIIYNSTSHEGVSACRFQNNFLQSVNTHVTGKKVKEMRFIMQSQNVPREKQGAESTPPNWLSPDHSCWLKCCWHLQNSFPPVRAQCISRCWWGGKSLGNPFLHLAISISSHNNPQKNHDTTRMR